jgi:fatty acid synthase subunit beta
VYKPFVSSLLADITSKVLVPLAEKAEADGFPYYTQGLDLISWLNGTSPRPTVDYLASIPLSLPLIGVAQLAQYLVSCRVTDVNPGEMRSLFNGATGHSQGVVSAVAVAASDSWDSLNSNILKAVKLLFYIGLRGQEAFPVLSVEPSIVADCVENNEGVPTPMLAVNGLSLKALETYINKTNSHLPSNSKVGVSLYNASTMHVVTGPPKALYGLATALRKIMAPAGLDQSKTPFSKRKAVFNMRFLPVNVPYHSPYLAGATQKLVEQDLNGEEVFTASQPSMAIYHTETGTLSVVAFQTETVLISRRGSPTALDVTDCLALRPDLHVAHPLGHDVQLPQDCHARRRLWSGWKQRYRVPYRTSPRGTRCPHRRRRREGQSCRRVLRCEDGQERVCLGHRVPA